MRSLSHDKTRNLCTVWFAKRNVIGHGLHISPSSITNKYVEHHYVKPCLRLCLVHPPKRDKAPQDWACEKTRCPNF